MIETLMEAKDKDETMPGIAMVPHSMDLAKLFQKFAEYWAGAGVDYLGMAAEGPVEMPVEVSLRWRGSVSGTLVVRCYPEFLKWLMESREYKPLNLCTQKEIFHEMATLYSVYLIQQFWISEIFELGLLLPKVSTPKDWPLREPDSTCSILVAQNPVEIRLWVD